MGLTSLVSLGLLSSMFSDGDCDSSFEPGSAEDIVELLVPEVQRRGLYWLDYPAPWGTIRENVGNVPGEPFLSKDHPGAKIEPSLTIVGPALLTTEEQVAHLHEAGLNEEVVPFNKPVADGSH